MGATTALAALVGAVSLGCGDADPVGDLGLTISGGDGSDDHDAESSGWRPDDESGAVETGEDDAASDAEVDDGCAGFYGGCEPDGGGVNIECDVWAQDCPADEKCMPWANDGGNSWNATKCSPLDPDPRLPGDACSATGSGVSGIDDCEVGSMCWDVDENNQGHCVAFCSGDEASPICTDPTTVCTIWNEGVLILCLPVCDPLLQECVDGQACYPRSDAFVCVPDGSGAMGAWGEACDYADLCDPGLFCASPEVNPACAGSIGCCTEFCDLLAPEPDLQCTGQPQGQVCVPWFAEGQAPPGLEDVGACLIPA